MQRIAHNMSECERLWYGVHNFLMRDECNPFRYEVPPLKDVVETLRNDPEVKILEDRDKPGTDKIVDIRDALREMPIEEVLIASYVLRHMNISKFDRPDELLASFDQGVIRPLYEMLIAGGFTWQRCLPYIFISGPGCSSPLHMDRSHVLAWQIYGYKDFVGFKDPARWATHEVRRQNVINFDPLGYMTPDEVTGDDWLGYEMPPGTVLWNAFHTMHVVTGGDEPSMSINLSFGGLRHRGRLCPHESDVLDFLGELAAIPEAEPAKALA